MQMKEMNADDFESFRMASTKRRAQYHESEGDLKFSEALRLAEEEFSKYCPQGYRTPDHFFFNLILETGTVAGSLWFAIRQRGNKKRLFINEIFVEESHRGQGRGVFMMSWLETKARQLGVWEIGLHVLGDNTVARSLYEKMGYAVSNLDMVRKISQD